MLQNKDGIISNALELGSKTFVMLAQDKRVDVPIKLPAKGVPLTSGAKVVNSLYLNKPVVVKGKAMKRTTILDFNANLFNEGIIYETIDNRRAYLKFLFESASNKSNRVRAQRELERFNQAVSGMNGQSIIWLCAVDKRGELYVSSSGAMNLTDVDLKSIAFSSDKNLRDYLNEYEKAHVGSANSIASLNIVKLPALNLNTALTESEVKQAIALTGCLLTIRGFHAKGRSAEDVMAEWNMVAQPLLEALPDVVFSSWDMPWAISTFPGLTLSTADKARANVVAPYLSASAGIFASSASNAVTDQTRMITLFKQGEWNFTNNTYSCRFNNNTILFDPAINTVIASALAIEKGKIDEIALQVLEAAQVYGKAMGDGSSWARLLWCEWLGIYGFMGGLSINAAG